MTCWLIAVIASLLVVNVHAVPAPQDVNVFHTQSLYPQYALHHQPFPFNSYPNSFSQSAYVQHPLALKETIKSLETQLKNLQEISAKSSAALQQVNAKSGAAVQTKFATATFEAPKVDQKLKFRIIGETDRGVINIVNPFIAGVARTLDGQTNNTSEDGSQGNGTANGDDFLKGLVPFSNSNLDPVFGPEIAPKYEIHYLPEHLKFEDLGHLFPFAGPDFTSIGAGGILPLPEVPTNDQSTNQPSTNEPFTPGNDFGTSSTSQPDYSSENPNEGTTYNYFNSGDQTSSSPDLRLGSNKPNGEAEKPAAAEPTTKSETDSGVGAPPSIDAPSKTEQSSLVGGLPSFARLNGGAPLNRGRRVPTPLTGGKPSGRLGGAPPARGRRVPAPLTGGKPSGRLGGAPPVRGSRVPAPLVSGLRKSVRPGSVPAVKPVRH